MSRSWTIRRVDVLVLLVAAAAVAMSNDREVAESFGPDGLSTRARGWTPPVRTVVGLALRAGSDLMAALVVVTVGLGVAALRRPFVTAGKRWPGRGRAAIAAAALAVGYVVVREGLEMVANPSSGFYGLSNPHFLSDLLRFCEGFPKGAVLGAWSLLVLAGRWKSRAADGLERLGRILGWGWLASIALDLVRAACC